MVAHLKQYQMFYPIVFYSTNLLWAMVLLIVPINLIYAFILQINYNKVIG